MPAFFLIVQENSESIGSLGDWIYNYGYLAIFIFLILSGVGIPLGEDLIIIPAGFFVAQGRLDFLTTCAVAYCGVAMADIVWYMGCYFFGPRLIRSPLFKRLFHPKRMLEMKYQIDKRGVWFVALARFIPLSRTLMITAAGLFHLRWWEFIVPTAICILITVPMQVSLGWMIGKGFAGEEDALFFQLAIGLIVFVVGVVFVLSIYYKYRGAGVKSPRASIAFLRKIKGSKKLKRQSRL